MHGPTNLKIGSTVGASVCTDITLGFIHINCATNCATNCTKFTGSF